MPILLLSFLPLAILGHKIASVAMLAVCALAFIFASLKNGLTAGAILAAATIIISLATYFTVIASGVTPPIAVVLLLFPLLIYAICPEIEMRPRELFILLMILILYFAYFFIFQRELSFGNRTIGGFSENSFIGRFALNYGVGSPARAAVILTGILLLIAKMDLTSKTRALLNLLFFVLLCTTLNRLSILFSLVFLFHYYTLNSSFGTPLKITFVASTVIVMLLLPDFFPLLERLERIGHVFTITPDYASFDYSRYVENSGSKALLHSSDLVLVPLGLNLGPLGALLFFASIGIMIAAAQKAPFGGWAILYFAVIGFKNWELNFDLSLLFLFTICKLRASTVASDRTPISDEKHHLAASA